MLDLMLVNNKIITFRIRQSRLLSVLNYDGWLGWCLPVLVLAPTQSRSTSPPSLRVHDVTIKQKYIALEIRVILIRYRGDAISIDYWLSNYWYLQSIVRGRTDTVVINSTSRLQFNSCIRTTTLERIPSILNSR